MQTSQRAFSVGRPSGQKELSKQLKPANAHVKFCVVPYRLLNHSGARLRPLSERAQSWKPSPKPQVVAQHVLGR